MSDVDLDYLSTLKSLRDNRTHRLIDSYYPDTGPLRRELYGKHLEFFAAGAEHRERAFIAANKIGKTIVGAYEVECHMTGTYPSWWTGHRFAKPTIWWLAGDTGKSTRDIVQLTMLGQTGNFGTGMIPRDKLIHTIPKQGLANAIEIFYVKHVSGGKSVGTIKSYDQRREAFQGTNIDGIWLDEEPPMDIYTECTLRLMTTNGIIIITFIPFKGWTDLVEAFHPGEFQETA